MTVFLVIAVVWALVIATAIDGRLNRIALAVEAINRRDAEHATALEDERDRLLLADIRRRQDDPR